MTPWRFWLQILPSSCRNYRLNLLKLTTANRHKYNSNLKQNKSHWFIFKYFFISASDTHFFFLNLVIIWNSFYCKYWLEMKLDVTFYYLLLKHISSSWSRNKIIHWYLILTIYKWFIVPVNKQNILSVTQCKEMMQ